MKALVSALVTLTLLIGGGNEVLADAVSAELNMEDSQNPLMLMETSQGRVYLELFPEEAPRNVANFIALAEGEVEMRDPETGAAETPFFYDGQIFHRVVPGYLIQAGETGENRPGPDYYLQDEINADHLGLDLIPVLDVEGLVHPWLNIANRHEFQQQILAPLYRSMGIGEDSADSEIMRREDAIVSALRELTLKQSYQNLGYRYSDDRPSHPLLRGTLAMANTGPNSNQTEFFITVADTPWLQGKYTVIGRVTEGMEIVDRISQRAIDPETDSRLATQLFRLRVVDRQPQEID